MSDSEVIESTDPEFVRRRQDAVTVLTYHESFERNFAFKQAVSGFDMYRSYVEDQK